MGNHRYIDFGCEFSQLKAIISEFLKSVRQTAPSEFVQLVFESGEESAVEFSDNDYFRYALGGVAVVGTTCVVGYLGYHLFGKPYMKEKIQQAEKIALEEGYSKGFQKGIEEGVKKGFEKGMKHIEKKQQMHLKESKKNSRI